MPSSLPASSELNLTTKLATANRREPISRSSRVDHEQMGMVSGPSQNAISTLLLPPISRTGLAPQTATQPISHKSPSFRDIPPVALIDIPHVEASSFKEYLDQIGSLFDKVQRLKLEHEDGQSNVFRGYIPPDKEEMFAGLKKDERNKDSNMSISSWRPTSPGLSKLAEIPYGSRKTGILQNSQLLPTPLSTVPSVYFDENFHLENPRTFDVVSEYAEVVRQPQSTRDDSQAANDTISSNLQPGRKALTTNAILQEKLSWYMDIVEINLISSISDATASFFAALTSLHELQSEAAASVAKTQKLRKDLAHLDRQMVVRGLRIISMKQRRANSQKLGDSLEQLRCVLKGFSYCVELVDSAQLEMAMHHISYVEKLVAGKFDPNMGDDLSWLLPNPLTKLIDIRQLHALRELPQNFAQLRQRIGEGYVVRLREVLMSDLHQHVSSASQENTLVRWEKAAKRACGMTGASSTPAYVMKTENLREELTPILKGLQKSQFLGPASATLREAIIRAMKSIIRKHLPTSTEDDKESITSTSTQTSNGRTTQMEKSRILSRNLRALEAVDAEAFFVNVYCEIGEALRRLSIQVKILLDITSNMEKTFVDVPKFKQSLESLGEQAVSLPSSLMVHDFEDSTKQALDISCLLELAVEKSHLEIAKILRIRTEQTVRLALSDFLRYFTLNRLFVNECEAVSGHFGAPLQGVVDNQIREFISVMHEVEMQKLASKMESEKWERISFMDDDALTLAHITQSMTVDPSSWFDFTNATTTRLEADELVLQSKSEAAKPMIEQDKKNPKPAVIEEERFSLVDSAVFALRGIEQYTVLLASVPSMANDISKVLIEYLRLYNSRTQQLILGTGAKRTAGLTNINTKHLSLASQSLSFFTALIPYLRECVRRRPLVAGSTLAEYDRLKRLLQEHQNAIHEKLIDIMKLRAILCIKTMEETDWDDRDEVQRSISPHVETIMKETLTLRRVLSKYLPVLSVRMILGPVFVIYDELWSKAFEDAVVWTEAGKARLLRDAELLEANLGNIDGAGEFGAHIVSIAKGKMVKSQPDTCIDTSSIQEKPM